MSERKKILLIDDAQTVPMMEQMVLSKGPYDVTIARDGEGAIQRARTERPSLVLMDVLVSRLNGFEAVAQLRADPATAGTPTIMMTTCSEVANMEKGSTAGCNEYATKPVNARELTRVGELIGG